MVSSLEFARRIVRPPTTSLDLAKGPSVTVSLPFERRTRAPVALERHPELHLCAVKGEDAGLYRAVEAVRLQVLIKGPNPASLFSCRWERDSSPPRKQLRQCRRWLIQSLLATRNLKGGIPDFLRQNPGKIVEPR